MKTFITTSDDVKAMVALGVEYVTFDEWLDS